MRARQKNFNMTTIETEENKMAEEATKQQEVGASTDKEIPARKSQGELRRKPVWEKAQLVEAIKNDIRSKFPAIDDSAKYESAWGGSTRPSEYDVIRRYKELQRKREERRAARETQPEPQLEPQPRKSLLSRIGERLGGFLAQPNREVARLRDVEMQSSEAYKDMFKDAGKRLRGAAGYLRGIGAAFGKGVVGGAKAFSTEFRKSSRSQSSPTPGITGGAGGP